MSTRYTDFAADDFIVRQRSPSIPQMLILFLSALVVAISVTLAVNDKLALVFILFGVLGALAWYVVVQTQRSRDLVLTTEFQNALFSSALGMNNKFCMIVKPDGTIVFFDRPFQDMFADFVRQPQRNLDVLLSYGEVSKENREKIWANLAKKAADKVIFDIRGGNNRFAKIVLSIEPIKRPSGGYILLRGREFVEQRSAAGDAPADASSPEVKKKS